MVLSVCGLALVPLCNSLPRVSEEQAAVAALEASNAALQRQAEEVGQALP
jgi:hypothetical protein